MFIYIKKKMKRFQEMRNVLPLVKNLNIVVELYNTRNIIVIKINNIGIKIDNIFIFS